MEQMSLAVYVYQTLACFSFNESTQGLAGHHLRHSLQQGWGNQRQKNEPKAKGLCPQMKAGQVETFAAERNQMSFLQALIGL